MLAVKSQQIRNKLIVTEKRILQVDTQDKILLHIQLLERMLSLVLGCLGMCGDWR